MRALNVERVEQAGERIGVGGGAGALAVEIARAAIARRIPGDRATLRAEMFELVGPAGRARADAVQEDDGVATTGLAVGDGEAVRVDLL